jgi:HK97 family phage portal protein
MFGIKTLFKKLGYVPEKKSAFNWGDSASIVTINQFTSNLIYNADYTTLAREGYIENAISHTCISRTAKAVASIPFKVTIDGEDIKDNNSRLARALKNVIKDPNADYSFGEILQAVQSHRMFAERAYIYPQFNSSGEPDLLEFFRPDRVSFVTNSFNTIGQYRYSNGSRNITFERDEDQRFDLIDIRSFNPLSDVNGLPPTIPGGISIDSHTEANRYNKQIVQNGAKPSGMVTLQDKENSGMLDEAEIKNLQDRFKQLIARDNGGIFFSGMPAKFESINFSNAEMDWLNGIRANAITICNVYGYHPFLLGLESTTFTNMDAAIQNWYETSVIPSAQDIFDKLGTFYSRKLGVDIEFKVEPSDILALAPRFKEMRKESRDNWLAGGLTLNEFREKIGKEEMAGGDDIMVDQNGRPMNGQIEG